MNHKQIKEAWNAQADEHNQWASLGEDEMIEFALQIGGSNRRGHARRPAMTNYEFEARQLIGTWLAKEKIKPIGTLRHVYPRCYVVGKAAKSGLIVARPWKDSEEHMKVHTKKYPLSVIHTFDTDLDAGDWCATAYVCHAGVQETVAVGWKK